MLTAVKSGEELPGADVLRYRFSAASERATAFLGAALGRAMLPHVPAYGNPLGLNLAFIDRTLRIGLCSDGKSGIGKSIFARAVIGTMGEKMLLQSAQGGQNLWFSRQAGWIRHYDCKAEIEEAEGLYAYVEKDKPGCSTPLTDIAEHPHDDLYDRQFDCLVFFERNSSHERSITIAVTPELARSEEFQDFLKETIPARTAAAKPLPAAAPI